MALTHAELSKYVHQNKGLIQSIEKNIDRLAREIVDYAVDNLNYDENFYVADANKTRSDVLWDSLGNYITLSDEPGDYLTAIMHSNGNSAHRKSLPGCYYFDSVRNRGYVMYEDIPRAGQLQIAFLLHDLLFPEV